MTTINITGGSEKQNAWATQIAQDWHNDLAREIEISSTRPDADSIKTYNDALSAAMVSFMGAMEKISAKQVIDMHTRKISPVVALINQAKAAK